MAKLYYYYSAMNAGKTTTLLQSNHNYQECGMRTLLLSPNIDTRAKPGLIRSRIGLEKQGVVFTKSDNLFLLAQSQASTNCVLIDEAQFMTKQQVSQTTQIVDQLKIPVLAYGIRTDFLGMLFEGSQYLLAWADEIVEIKTICSCGSKATMNLRIDSQGNPIKSGQQIHIGANESYHSKCRKCFREALRNQYSDMTTA